MFTEFHFDDIIFGIFPMVGGTVEYAYECWAKNSVGDIVDMLMQALEVRLTFHMNWAYLMLTHRKGLAFIHESKIAHRVCIYNRSASIVALISAYIAFQDAFRDNFLVQWHPESMRTSTTPVSRPRVYLIDFEVAISFPTERPLAECVCTGPPLGGSFSQPEMYSRPLAPEMTTNAPYSPFKTDVWQLGTSFWDFRVRKFLYFVFSSSFSDYFEDNNPRY
jgi:serine/threonine protein kinase